MQGNVAVAYTIEPAIIIIANDHFGLDVAQHTALAAGGRVMASMSTTEASIRLGNQLTPDALVVELSEDGGARLDHLLDHIDSIATRDGCAVLVSVTPDLIDPVAARLATSEATILCNPTPAERVAAMAIAWGKRSARVHDRSQEFDAMRLQHLADEVGRIAKTLASFSTPTIKTRQTTLGDAGLAYKFELPDAPREDVNAGEIRMMIKLRRLRERHFDPELFADPAWDMMLDLMAARIEHVRVSVSSLCIAAAVPPTTALRWIKTLTEQGVFVRVADPTDGRRVFIELSDSASTNISNYLLSMKKTGQSTI